MKTQAVKQLETLLEDFGYRLYGDILIDNGIPGRTSPRIVGSFSSALSACEYLCPIIRDKGFTERLVDVQMKSLTCFH